MEAGSKVDQRARDETSRASSLHWPPLHIPRHNRAQTLLDHRLLLSRPVRFVASRGAESRAY